MKRQYDCNDFGKLAFIVLSIATHQQFIAGTRKSLAGSQLDANPPIGHILEKFTANTLYETFWMIDGIHAARDRIEQVDFFVGICEFTTNIFDHALVFGMRMVRIPCKSKK